MCKRHGCQCYNSNLNYSLKAHGWTACLPVYGIWGNYWIMRTMILLKTQFFNGFIIWKHCWDTVGSEAWLEELGHWMADKSVGSIWFLVLLVFLCFLTMKRICMIYHTAPTTMFCDQLQGTERRDCELKCKTVSEIIPFSPFSLCGFTQRQNICFIYSASGLLYSTLMIKDECRGGEGMGWEQGGGTVVRM